MLVRQQIQAVFKTHDEIRSTAAAYFDYISKRIPIISSHRFVDRLGTSFYDLSAGFAALCLCMHLLLQHPLPRAQTMQSTLYLTTKNVITLLESTGSPCLELVQCRLLVSFYEIGHGISPGASVSIAACARTARALGLNKQWVQSPVTEHNIEAEEIRRVWWAVFNLDRSISPSRYSELINIQGRYVNLQNEDALFGTEDPRTDVPLPYDDARWAQNVRLQASSCNAVGSI